MNGSSQKTGIMPDGKMHGNFDMVAASRRLSVATHFAGVLHRLQTVRTTLPPTAGRIADFVLSVPDRVIVMSITQLCEEVGVSQGSVVGLCQKIGASGFGQLKTALAAEIAYPLGEADEEPNIDDDVAMVARKVFQAGRRTLDETLRSLDAAAMRGAVRAIKGASRVEVFGSGSARPLAEDAHYRLVRIGINAQAHVDSHLQMIAASLANPGVAVLAISHSGSTIETVSATARAHQGGARTIAITNFGQSPLVQHADIVLCTIAHETQFGAEAMTSRIAQLAMVDTLVACLALADYDRSVETVSRTYKGLVGKHI